MKLFIPSMPVSAAWTNDSIAAEEIPCASGVLRRSADCGCAGCGCAVCAGARCASSATRTMAAAAWRAFILRLFEEDGDAGSTGEQLEPLRWQRHHRRDAVADAQQGGARGRERRPRRN